MFRVLLWGTFLPKNITIWPLVGSYGKILMQRVAYQIGKSINSSQHFECFKLEGESLVHLDHVSKYGRTIKHCSKVRMAKKFYCIGP